MKTGIALSGGGDKGAFTVGVIKKLTELGSHYDMISGTSTGALIAPFLAAGEIDLIEQIYTNVSKDDVILTSGAILRAMNSDSLYDINPLRHLLNKILTEEIYQKVMNSGKEIYISTVCLNNGQITYFTNCSDAKGGSKYDIIKWRNRKELIRCIMASSVQPVLMSPEDIKGNRYVDGGVKEYLPVDILIDRLADDITGIMTTAPGRYYDTNDYSKITDILIKTIDILSGDVSYNDLRIAKIYNDGLRYIDVIKQRIQRNSGWSDEKIESYFTSAFNPFYGKRLLDLKIIRPEHDLGNGLEFDTMRMRNMFNIGYLTGDINISIN